MKLVWKCDYCSQTNVDKDKIEKHEMECSFNLANKSCWTCDNLYDYYECEYCKVHYNGWPSKTDNSEHFFLAREEKIKCNEWVNIKSRTKKLEKIKDVIENSKI